MADEQMQVIAGLRDEIERRRKRGQACANKVATLRAQLAERDSLLDRVVDHANFWHDHPYAEVVEAIARDYKALSASAEPNAPGVLPRAHDVNMFQRTAEPGAKS